MRFHGVRVAGTPATRKSAVVALVSLAAILIAPAAQISADEIPPGAVRNFSTLSGEATTYPKGFFIPAYFELDDPATDELNDKFDLIIVGRQSHYSGISSNKTLMMTGPGLIYSNSLGRRDEWNVIDSHEDWFLHSSPVMSPEARIPLSDLYPHLFFMNVGSEGWRNFVASRYAEVVAGNPSISGVFVDGVPQPAEYVSQLGAAYPDYDEGAYVGHTLELIRAIKDAVLGKLVILNSELYETFTSAGNGGMAEGFVHFGGRRNDEHISRARWLENIELIAGRSLDGKYVLVGSGSLEATLPTMVEYCYASFLIGYNPSAHCYFYWHSNAEGGYSTINWFPVWEMDIGQPLEGYSESGGVYHRSFSGGLVMVNPSDVGDPITVDLDGTYINSSGDTVVSVSLANKTGAVLKRAL